MHIYNTLQVDADQHRELGERFEVQGFPTILTFRNGVKDESYSGPRQADGIVSYAKMNRITPYAEVSSVDELKSALKVIGTCICIYTECVCVRTLNSFRIALNIFINIKRQTN